jgi:hypothetical protein
MKKISSILFICVFIFGITTIFSGVASATIMMVGDPFEGNSWCQQLHVYNSDPFDNIHISIGSQDIFEDKWSSNNDNWNLASYSSKNICLSGISINDLSFVINMIGNIPDSASFFIQCGFGNIIRDSGWFCWNKNKGWSCNKSVPDAGIMWLLGPAFIALAILGRKRAKQSS